MGNQQDCGKVEEIEWAWLAGMMNGDGCFSLKLRKRDKRWKCDVSITLTQTDPSVIWKASDILVRGIGCNPPIQEYEPSGNCIRTKYNMRITKMSHMIGFIENVEAYMCGIKLAKARLMLRYLRNRARYNGLSRKKHLISDDLASLSIASDFYKLCGSSVPKEISTILRDHPKGVGPSGSKHQTPTGEDMVQSCVRAQAASSGGTNLAN